MQGDALRIVYDGQCPFCTRFVELYRIRENVGRVELLDARQHRELLDDIAARGFDINVGMIAIWEGRYYHGEEAMTLMTMLSADNGVFAHMNRLLFSKPSVAAKVYPWLVRGRNLVLRMLGRSII